MVVFRRGILLPGSGMWFDPQGAKDFAFVSHGHSDHTGRHRRTLCTAPTARFMQARLGRGKNRTWETLEFGHRREFGSWSATLFPAGHVLGSAQIFYESAEGTVLYTGDFKVRPSLSCETLQTRSAETLVMETTFGRPRYQFPPTEEVAAGILKFCHDALSDGVTPVLQAYSLGKAQETLAMLRSADLPIMVHPAVAEMTRIYEEFGVAFPAYRPHQSAEEAGHVVIGPPRKTPDAHGPRRVAMLTGWALDPGAIYRMRVDAVFPLSDHADYPDLLRYVEKVAPRRVFTLHGFAAEFARDLRARGIEAWSLSGEDQLEFLLNGPVP